MSAPTTQLMLRPHVHTEADPGTGSTANQESRVHMPAWLNVLRSDPFALANCILVADTHHGAAGFALRS